MDPLSTSLLFEQFRAQRRYLKNVTPSTIEWCEVAFNLPPLTKSGLQESVVAVGFECFLRWAHCSSARSARH
jgi:hypothetical protein